MSYLNIIRSLIEFFIIIGFSVTIYHLLSLKDKQEKPQEDKPVQFTGKDFFSIDLD